MCFPSMRGGFDSRRPHQTKPQYQMKKFSKSFMAVALASLFSASVMFAAADKAASKVAGCCTKAQADGKPCAHACCVEAAKAGNNCTKCGGSGKIAKTDAKK